VRCKRFRTRSAPRVRSSGCLCRFGSGTAAPHDRLAASPSSVWTRSARRTAGRGVTAHRFSLWMRVGGRHHQAMAPPRRAGGRHRFDGLSHFGCKVIPAADGRLTVAVGGDLDRLTTPELAGLLVQQLDSGPPAVDVDLGLARVVSRRADCRPCWRSRTLLVGSVSSSGSAAACPAPAGCSRSPERCAHSGWGRAIPTPARLRFIGPAMTLSAALRADGQLGDTLRR
jgi:hypothetical protein